MTTQDTIKEFDPNRVLCGRMCKFEVELVLVMFEYSKTVVVEVTGNSGGFATLQQAAEAYAESCLVNLYKQWVYKDVLLNGPEEILNVEVESENEFLDLVVSARILSATDIVET